MGDYRDSTIDKAGGTTFVVIYMAVSFIVGIVAYSGGLELWKSFVAGVGWWVFAALMVGEFVVETLVQ